MTKRRQTDKQADKERKGETKQDRKQKKERKTERNEKRKRECVYLLSNLNYCCQQTGAPLEGCGVVVVVAAAAAGCGDVVEPEQVCAAQQPGRKNVI